MPDALKYSDRERFSWLKDAALLDKSYLVNKAIGQLDYERQVDFIAGQMPKELPDVLNGMFDKKHTKEILRTIAAHPEQIRDYCKVRQSLDSARGLWIRLVRSEASIADLDKKGTKDGKVVIGNLRQDERKVALQMVRCYGSVQGTIIAFAIETARKQNDLKFFRELGKALTNERVPEIDYDRISDVARFLVYHWCGNDLKGNHLCGKTGFYGELINIFKTAKIGNWTENGSFVWKHSPGISCERYMPPLCFFTGKALAAFCAMALGRSDTDKEMSREAIRKWVSRLGLAQANQRNICEVEQGPDGIYFRVVTRD